MHLPQCSSKYTGCFQNIFTYIGTESYVQITSICSASKIFWIPTWKITFHQKRNQAFIRSTATITRRYTCARWKVSQPNLRETRDKRWLGRDQDRSWCHRHTSVKAFLVAAHGSMDWHTRSVAVTPAPLWVPTQWLLVPSLMSVVG